MQPRTKALQHQAKKQQLEKEMKRLFNENYMSIEFLAFLLDVCSEMVNKIYIVKK